MLRLDFSSQHSQSLSWNHNYRVWRKWLVDWEDGVPKFRTLRNCAIAHPSGLLVRERTLKHQRTHLRLSVYCGLLEW